MAANLLMNKYFTRKSLLLKDLDGTGSKSLISKDRTKGGRTYSRSRREVKVYIVVRSDRRSVKRRWLVMPAPKSRLDLLVDAMTDCLHNLGLDDVALRVDGDLDDDVTCEVSGQFSPVDRRIRIHNRIGNMDFMASNRSVNHRAQRRSSAGIVVAGFGIGENLLRLRCWLGWLGLRKRAGFVRLRLEHQLRRVWGFVCAGWKVSYLIGVCAVSVGEPGWAQVDHLGIVEYD